MKKLPSRKMRGRILSSASLNSGSAGLLISIVTMASPLPVFFSGSTSETTPTFTPAMRTGDFFWMLLAEWKTALSSNGFENGL